MGVFDQVNQGLNVALQRRRQSAMDQLARQKMEQDQMLQQAIQGRLGKQMESQTALNAAHANYWTEGLKDKDADRAQAQAEKTTQRFLGPTGETIAKDPEFSDLYGKLMPLAERYGKAPAMKDVPDYDPATGKGGVGMEDFGNVREGIDTLADPVREAASQRAKSLRQEKWQHDLDVAKMKADMVPPAIVPGPGGEMYRVPKRSGPATPVTTAGAAPGDAPKPLVKDKVLPAGDAKAMNDLRTDAANAADVYSRFKDDYAGKGMVGGAVVGVEKALGSWAPQEAQDEANFWSDYKRVLETPQRHAMFGGALTPTESAIWDRGQTLSPKSDPKTVRAQFQWMLRTLNGKLDGLSGARAAEGFNPKALDVLTGKGAGGGAAPSGGGFQPRKMVK